MSALHPKKNALQRILSGIGANAYGQVVAVGIQLLSVPIFLLYWDSDTYGKWLLLSAVPAYLSLMDLGIIAVASNKIVICLTKGESNQANIIFQSAIYMTAALTTAAIAISALTVFIPNYTFLQSIDHKFALFTLIMIASINLISGLFDAAFRAANKYAQGVYLLNSTRVVETICGLILLSIHQSFLSVALGQLIARAICTTAIYFYIKQILPELRWGISERKSEEVRKLILPGLAFLSFPIGNAISIQGLTILVGAYLGPSSAAIFGTYRTLSRVLVQLVTTVSRAAWPEISRLFALRDIDGIKRITNKGTYICAILSVLLAIPIYTFSSEIVEFWTHGKIPPADEFFLLLLFASAITSFWQLPMVVLAATNNHEKISLIFLLSTLVCISISAKITPLLGLEGTAISLILIEVCMLIMSHLLVNRFYRNQSND